MKLRWSAPAKAQFEEQLRYWTRINPQVARRFKAAVLRDLQCIRRQPYSGRRGVGDSRETVVQRTPFVVIYQVYEMEVVVMNVWHGAQDWPFLDDGRTLGPNDE